MPKPKPKPKLGASTFTFFQAAKVDDKFITSILGRFFDTSPVCVCYKGGVIDESPHIKLCDHKITVLAFI
jgi:hypothetical protein